MKKLGLPVVASHIIGWLVFQSLPLAFLLSQPGRSFESIFSSFTYWQFWLYFVAVFYLHNYVLLPHLFNAGKKIPYTIIVLGMLLSVFYIRPFDRMANAPRNQEARVENRMPPSGNDGFRRPPPDNFRQPRRGPNVDIISIFLFVMTIMFSFANNITKRWRLTEQRAARAEADKANAELSFLKAQINPHFLFNTLNNIYSMAVTKNENIAGTLLKLSNIMRYVTDDVNVDYVALQSEVDCISNYIDLQKLRLGKKVSLQYTVTGNLEEKKIAPLILMTFIENVFKYGISNHEDSEIRIQLSVEGNGIRFFARNRLFTVTRKDDRTGIGIRNTIKRLDHLYPGKHNLEIIRENGLFTVALFLQD